MIILCAYIRDIYLCIMYAKQLKVFIERVDRIQPFYDLERRRIPQQLFTCREEKGLEKIYMGA